MFKWIGWAIRTVLTAVLLSFLCIWTTGYIVNSYMETLLKQLELPLQTQPFALSGIWGKLWGAAPPVPSKQAESTASASPSETKEAVSSPAPSASESESTPDSLEQQADEPSPAPSEDPAVVPVFGNQSGSSGLSEQQKLSLQTVMSKLNAEQLSELSALLEDGLTSEELAQAGDLLKPSLSAEEYKQMMDMLKTHAEAAKVPPHQP
ncbi:hypothetical protein E5161_10970 [Cohnella pontilimi]|uniref:Uncharacterized protein n=1 Tax=Cohnella pontilimi TaxID=2564100 RepID=A0A4V5LS39_9BACL|nr:hypothetical protein [Cohnella pontilimi]TJY41729.1 hypothetical protein E5161_10970 [Cohnella pontilimi]